VSSHIVYCSCSKEGRILRFALDEASGHLQRLGEVALPDAQAPTISHPLALTLDRRFLLAAVRVLPYRIATFAVSPADGSLAYLGAAQAAGSLAWLTLDVTGAYVLGASLPDSILTLHRIDPQSGIAQEVQVIRDVSKAHSIVLDAANRFAYAAALGEDRVRQLRFDARNGTLLPAPLDGIPLHAGAGPRHLAFDPVQRRLYCLNETDGTIDVLACDAANGALSRVQTTSLFSPGDPRPDNVRSADLAIDPGGRWLYATERSSSTLATFRIDPLSGELERISSIPTASSPRGIRMTPSGRLLLVAGELSEDVVVYRIDAATGGLDLVCRERAAPGANWIVMMERPDGH
jgi:6-phosphogluconolactonase